MTFPSFPKPCAVKEMYGRCVKPHCRDSHEESKSYKIQKYLMDAKKTVDIAAQAITSHQIADVLEKLAKGGVRVRIIRDYDNLSLLKGTEKVSALQKFGVQFKVNGKLDPEDPKTMFVAGIFHHKFVIVDSKVLIHGSGNFTLKAVLQNYECAVATNLPDVVGKIQKHYNNCWESFDNAILK
ncbi:hypothetical protein RvY_10633 [Ramazzottius varieornatus]|uniref:Mitochondrial cardiolipin hydrolase n=1 Tax=Ramazzottius varieornatus TaxID=947166 RepID=A0A1D1VHW7_RAMVA|nr:hypothetical protein RvY_10633 [Ramazzottius varieornatus]